MPPPSRKRRRVGRECASAALPRLLIRGGSVQPFICVVDADMLIRSYACRSSPSRDALRVCRHRYHRDWWEVAGVGRAKRQRHNGSICRQRHQAGTNQLFETYLAFLRDSKPRGVMSGAKKSPETRRVYNASVCCLACRRTYRHYQPPGRQKGHGNLRRYHASRTATSARAHMNKEERQNRPVRYCTRYSQREYKQPKNTAYHARWGR